MVLMNRRIGESANPGSAGIGLKSAGDLTFSRPGNRSWALPFELVGELPGKFCGVAGYVKELRRQAAQLIKRKYVASDSFGDLRTASAPDQSQADLLPVRHESLRRLNPG